MSAQRGFDSIHTRPAHFLARPPLVRAPAPLAGIAAIAQVQVMSATWLENGALEVLSQVRRSICMYVPVRPQTHPLQKTFLRAHGV